MWPLNETLCEHLDFNERNLQRVRTRAIDTGLIKMRETKYNKHWERRRNNNTDDAVLERYGYDLSPLAERRTEFLYLIMEAEARRKQRGILRRACSSWLRKILGHIDYALQQGYDETRLFSLANEVRSLAGKAYRIQDMKLLLELDLELQKLCERIEFEIKQKENFEDEIDQSKIKVDHNSLNLMNMSCVDDMFDVLYTTTKQIICASHSSKLSEKFGKSVRNIVASKAFHNLFPTVRLAQDSKAKDLCERPRSAEGQR